MKYTYCIIALFLLTMTTCWAQVKWHNPMSDSTQTFIQNQGWNEDGGNYHRLPNRAKEVVREKVWKLSCESAGLAIRFKTNAKDISIRYKVSRKLDMPHMPSTGVSGVDLYRCDDNSFCFGNYTFRDTIQYNYTIDKIIKNQETSEYILYLPLYNEVTYMEIGVPEANNFSFVPKRTEKPIILYGTSIAQGACASRPAMAWGNIVGRNLDTPLINLGFSGNGRLETEIIELICEQNPSVVILDCMPNMIYYENDEIAKRLTAAILRIRQQFNMPILLVEHAGNSNQNTNNYQHDNNLRANKVQKDTYKQLKKNGVKGLYYITKEELNFHPDSWVDYVHPSDFGMMQHATVITNCLRKILK